MSAGRTVEGAGCVTWWGFGPARDLLSSGKTRLNTIFRLNTNKPQKEKKKLTYICLILEFSLLCNTYRHTQSEASWRAECFAGGQRRSQTHPEDHHWTDRLGHTTCE